MRVGKYAFLNCAFLLVGLNFQAISLVAQFPIAGARLFAGLLFFSNRFFFPFVWNNSLESVVFSPFL